MLGLNDLLHWLVDQLLDRRGKTVSNNIAVDVSFGTIGSYLTLLRQFKQVVFQKIN